MAEAIRESAAEKRAEELCERYSDPPPPELQSPSNHSRTIRWQTRAGEEAVVTSSGCRSPAHALAAAYADAVAQGYRQPRWWQLWRRITEPNYERMLRAATAEVSRQRSPAARGMGIAGTLHEGRG